MDQETLRPARLFGLLALLVLALGCLLVLRPFMSALLWAVILAYTTWPAFRMLRERLGLSPGVAAAAMVTAEFLLIGLPLVFATPLRREEIEALRGSVEAMLVRGLPDLVLWLGTLPLVGEPLSRLFSGWDTTFSGLLDGLSPYAGTIAGYALSFLLAVLSGIAELLLAIFLAFFFYRDGPAIAERAQVLMEKLAWPGARRLLQLTGDVTRSVVYGLLGTALAQGAMTMFGLWIAGVPQPVLLGVVAGLISILPVGAPLVWAPAAIWLFIQGQTGWGLFMLVYGAGGISSVDNFIRPWLISRGSDLPLLVTLLGAVGGVLAFGFLGLFLGPVLLAVGFTLLSDWARPGLAGRVTGRPT